MSEPDDESMAIVEQRAIGKVQKLRDELAQAKAEIETVREVSGNRLKLWMDVCKDRDKYFSLAEKLAEAARKYMNVTPFTKNKTESIARKNMSQALSLWSQETGGHGNDLH